MEPDVNPATPENDSPREPPLAKLLAQLFRDAEALLLQQLALFGAEMSENAGRFATGLVILLAGLLTLFIGVAALIAALILSLGYLLPMWLSCALVGVLVTAGGAALVLYGRRLMARTALAPQRTLQSLRETGEWLREELT